MTLLHTIRETNILGHGAFGTVTRGLLKHIKPGTEEAVEVAVAVKSIEGDASEEDRVLFLQEAAIMGQFNHPDIIKILGVQILESKASFLQCLSVCFFYC